MKLSLKEIILAGIFTALTAIMTQISITLPFSPVPITFTLLAIFLASAILGSKVSVFSQIAYILLGIFGVPVFSGFHGGLGIILGPTGGYILSYPIMAFIIGLVIEQKRNVSRMDMVGIMIIGLITCYTVGAFWMAAVLHLDASKAIATGVAPFLPLDIIKIVAAAFAAYQIRLSLIKSNLLPIFK